jgi:hypothetical protein
MVCYTAVSSKEIETYYRYIEVLKYNEKYAEANQQMNLFA